MAIRTNWANGEQWNASDQNELNTAVLAAEVASKKGQPNGYASLNSSGIIPLTQQTYAVLDGGTSSSAGADVINGGTPASA